jgi:hypothetical protein
MMTGMVRVGYLTALVPDSQGLAWVQVLQEVIAMTMMMTIWVTGMLEGPQRGCGFLQAGGSSGTQVPSAEAAH